MNEAPKIPKYFAFFSCFGASDGRGLLAHALTPHEHEHSVGGVGWVWVCVGGGVWCRHRTFTSVALNIHT